MTPPQAARRKRLIGLIVALAAITLATVAATYLPRTYLLPTSLRVPNPRPFLEARNRDERWTQDLTYLARELPRLHIDAFHTISQREFEGYVEEVRAAIPTLSDDEIVIRLMALVARIGDGHTSLDFSSRYQGETPWRIYPLSLVWMETGWSVVGTDDAHTHLLGAQLVAIDDVPAAEAFHRVGVLVSADNDMQRRATGATLLVTAEILAALEIVTEVEQARFSFILVDGQPAEQSMQPLVPQRVQLQGLQPQPPLPEPPLAEQHPELWYWYEVVPEANTLYFQYDVCAEMADLPFADFSAALFNTVDNAGLNRVIVDVRANGGGNSAVLRPFLAGLAERPDLQTYVLIGRHTFSSALMNAIELDQQANAILVGEPTGGRPNHYGEVRTFTLPNSQLPVNYSTKFFRLLPDSDPLALEPEIPTPWTVADRIAGHDAALNAALAP